MKENAAACSYIRGKTGKISAMNNFSTDWNVFFARCHEIYSVSNYNNCNIFTLLFLRHNVLVVFLDINSILKMVWISVKINRLQDDNISIKPFFEISQNEKYDDLDFIDVISEILDYVKRHNEITLHIKGQGIYTLVELYSENDFYDYDRCKIESDLIVKKKNIYKDGIYYMKFLLKGTNDDVRENL